jgi:hypothetical protein
MTSPTPRRPQGGPPLLAPAIAYGALMIAAAALAAGVPHPDASAAAFLSYDQSHQSVIKVSGTLAFAAAVPLAIWTATAYRRLRALGITAPGAVIGLSGGLLAAASLAMSGLIGWTAGQLGGANTPELARALGMLWFAVGSAGFVVPVGLLVAGVAVPSLILRLTWRPLAWAGLVVAAISLLSTFTLIAPALDATLPVGRFGSLIWLLIVSVTLPHSRHEVPRPNGQDAQRVAA